MTALNQNLIEINRQLDDCKQQRNEYERKKTEIELKIFGCVSRRDLALRQKNVREYDQMEHEVSAKLRKLSDVSNLQKIITEREIELRRQRANLSRKQQRR